MSNHLKAWEYISKGFSASTVICTGQANDLVHVAREPNTTEGFTNWLQLGLSQQVCLCDPTKVSMGHEGTEVVKAESPIIIFLIGHNYY